MEILFEGKLSGMIFGFRDFKLEGEWRYFEQWKVSDLLKPYLGKHVRIVIDELEDEPRSKDEGRDD